MAMSPKGNSNRKLEGWKNISEYLGCDEKTARLRWKEEGLPVYRESNSPKARVFAVTAELDEWKKARVVGPSAKNVQQVTLPPEHPSTLEEDSSQKRRRWFIFGAFVVSVVLFIGYWKYQKRESTLTPVAPTTEPAATPPRLFGRVSAEHGRVDIIRLPEAFHDIVISPDSKRAYLAIHAARGLAMIDVNTMNLQSWKSPLDVRSLAVSPDSKKLFVGAFSDGLVTMDARTGRVLSQISTGGAVSDIAVSPDGRRIYLAMMHRGIRRYSLDTEEWKQLTTLGCPYYCSIDPQGTKLLVGYQCGRPTGRDGHDAVEVFDLKTEKSQLIYSGVPIAANRHAFFPNSELVWLNGGDACSRDIYDRLGCPPEFTQIHHILRLSDGKILHSIPLPLPFGLWPDLFAAGQRVLAGYADYLSVLDTHRFAAVESYRYPSKEKASNVVFADDGKALLTFPDLKQLWVLTSYPGICDEFGSGAINRFSADGTEQDAIENARVLNPPAYAPGLVGQAFNFQKECSPLSIQRLMLALAAMNPR